MKQGEVLAQIGMDLAANAANIRWLKLARWTVEQMASKREPFTADDVLLFMADIGVDTKERRALGAVFRTASQDGLIVATGRYIKSTRPESHARPCAQWVGTARATEVRADA